MIMSVHNWRPRARGDSFAGVALCGIGESALVETIADLLANQTNPTLAPLATQGEVRLRITAAAATVAAADAAIAELEQKLRFRLGPAIYGVDDDTLEAIVVGLLRQRGETLAVAESCTGGLLANRITDVPGASAVFERGVVAYSNRAKTELLGVPAPVIQRAGAVSSEVATLMARGIRERTGAIGGLGSPGLPVPAGGRLRNQWGWSTLPWPDPVPTWCGRPVLPATVNRLSAVRPKRSWIFSVVLCKVWTEKCCPKPMLSVII